MNGLLKWFLDNGLVQAQVMKAIRWAGTAISAAIVTLSISFLQKHGFVLSADMTTDIQNIGGSVAAGVVGLLTLLWSMRDAKHVDTAIKASAQAGEVVSTSSAKALEKGNTVTLPSGNTVVIGKPSPSDDPSVTAALNKSQTNP